MSTHNIGFYEEISKIIFELSSNIIKYAPYFFCCLHRPVHSMFYILQEVITTALEKFAKYHCISEIHEF